MYRCYGFVEDGQADQRRLHRAVDSGLGFENQVGFRYREDERRMS